MPLPLTLKRFLTRLIWVCVGPLLLLALYLAAEQVQHLQHDRDVKAAQLVGTLAASIDRDLNGHIAAMNLLADSPLAADATRRAEFYREAQSFHRHIGKHLILADADHHMLFNTRIPYGMTLPKMPVPDGHAAAPIALQTRQPAVSDAFIGPVTQQWMLAVAVPVRHDGAAADQVLVSTFEASQWQHPLDAVALPAGWTLRLVDSNHRAIAQRVDAGYASDQVDDSGRFQVKSRIAPWSVVLEVPRAVLHGPMIASAATMAAALTGATLAGVLGKSRSKPFLR